MMDVNRGCSLCGKPIKSLSGLGRHAPYCKGRISLSGMTSEAQNILMQRQTGFSGCTQNDDNLLRHSDSLAQQVEDTFQLEAADACQVGIKAFTKPSTGSSLRSVSFEEATGIKAGTPISSHIDHHSSSLNTTAPLSDRYPPNSPFFPFDSEVDYALAMFFHQRQLTKGDVAAFFHDQRLAPIFNLLSFRNADEWYAKLNSIPCGLPLDNWRTATVTLASPIADIASQAYPLQYQDVENVIRFLLGHTPFNDNLTYSPVRLWNDSDSRVYTEMWTGDWWWEMQEKLPEKGTIVPLLIGIDKTVLTQHHGDLSAWPIYMTIGNLDSRTRRQQTRPALILIGFMPTMNGCERQIKAEAYHHILRIIFKRKN
jgi:Plavaka transposase